jgi:hypothetical protein
MTPAMRASGFAVVLVLVAVAVLASLWPGESGRSWLVLPYWLDVARLEILVLAVLGGPAALVAGRAPYRVALGVPFLIIGITVQVMTAISLQGPGCASVISDLSIMLAFAPVILEHIPIVLVGIVLVAPVFAYAVLWRRPLLVRMGAVAALLLVVAGGTAVVEHPAGVAWRCLEF